jgi:hypothetical protein
MAFAQLRRRLPFTTSSQRAGSARPDTRVDAQRDALVAGSTAAIARSIDLLVRTDHLPGMDEAEPRGRPVRR